jgi:hypothetical protein
LVVGFERHGRYSDGIVAPLAVSLQNWENIVIEGGRGRKTFAVCGSLIRELGEFGLPGASSAPSQKSKQKYAEE